MRVDIDYAQRVRQLAGLCHQLRPHIAWLSPDEFLRADEQVRWQIVDVRPRTERHISIIPGALSRDAFEAQREADMPGRVLVYCVIGCHSGAYVQALDKKGIRAYNLWGGILAWVLAGGVLVTPGGEETRRVHVHGIPWEVLPPGYEAV
jgi:sodium/bile acid cotransporter 7